MNTGFRHHRRKLPPIGSLVLALGALMAFAGTASAHHHGDFGVSGDPTGTISTFDPTSGVLTIALTEGGSVSGLVTDETWISTGGDCHGKGDFNGDDRRGRKAGTLRHHIGGDDHGRHHGWWHHGGEGSSDDLVPGAVVDDAILVLAGGKATFAKIDLAKSDEGSSPTASSSNAKR